MSYHLHTISIGILLTFCLCIVAMLFTLKPDTTENFTADSNEIQLIPAERSEIYIAEVRKAEALKSIAAKVAASEQAETETEAGAEVEAEVAPEKSIVFPEDTVVKKGWETDKGDETDVREVCLGTFNNDRVVGKCCEQLCAGEIID